MVVLLEAEDPEWALERALHELAASESPFGSWYGTQMHRLFGCDFTRLPRVAGGKRLFAGEGRRARGSRSHRKARDPTPDLACLLTSREQA